MILGIVAVVVLDDSSAAAAAPIDVGTKLQVMWDDYVVDTNRTTAARVLHEPAYAGVAMVWDREWEGDGSEFPTIIRDVDGSGRTVYRMYYVGWSITRDYLAPAKQVYPLGIYMCYAESADGITWKRPDLGLCEFKGSRRNNIILRHQDQGRRWTGHLGVFKDANPACPPAERYKGLSMGEYDQTLNLFVSADGIRFTVRNALIRKDGREVMFDTANNGFWWPKDGRYHVYVRGHRRIAKPYHPFSDLEIRQIRHAVSPALDAMMLTVPLDYASADGGDTPEYPMYTNCIFPYPRNPDILVGFPTRYNERKRWTKTYDTLPDRKERHFRYKEKEVRFGLAITDGLFMCSRDGQHFVRYDEAFLRPGPERHTGWTYGSCYPAIGLVETPSADGSENVYSLYVPTGHWLGEPAKLERFTIRKDGFVSRRATYRASRVVTKPVAFRGDELVVNCSTSARGSIQVTVSSPDGAKRIVSEPVFGDRVERPVPFADGALAAFAGKPVTIEFAMTDADLYAFCFRKSRNGKGEKR